MNRKNFSILLFVLISAVIIINYISISKAIQNIVFISRCSVSTKSEDFSLSTISYIEKIQMILFGNKLTGALFEIDKIPNELEINNPLIIIDENTQEVFLHFNLEYTKYGEGYANILLSEGGYSFDNSPSSYPQMRIFRTISVYSSLSFDDRNNEITNYSNKVIENIVCYGTNRREDGYVYEIKIEDDIYSELQNATFTYLPVPPKSVGALDTVPLINSTYIFEYY